MNTQSHAIINIALLSRKGKPILHRYALFGAVLPDIPMFTFFFIETIILRHSQRLIWSEQYFLPQWQNVFDVFNSIPIILVGLGIGYYRKSDAITVLFWSMLFHCIVDFSLHHDDGHRHFFPFLEFRFKSPISYWDVNHYGRIASIVEIVLTLGASIYLFPRLQSRLTKAGLVVINLISLLFYTSFAIFA